MANKNDFRPLTPFAKAFAVEYKGWMKGHNVTLVEIASVLGRKHPYVQERVNGRRALDTLDVDALAQLTDMQPRDLMIELSKRAKIAVAEANEDELVAEAFADAALDPMALAALRSADKSKRRDRPADEGA